MPVITTASFSEALACLDAVYSSHSLIGVACSSKPLPPFRLRGWRAPGAPFVNDPSGKTRRNPFWDRQSRTLISLGALCSRCRRLRKPFDYFDLRMVITTFGSNVGKISSVFSRESVLGSKTRS
jgi:hypothetical protein